MAKQKFYVGDEVWYKIKSDDIRKGKIRAYAGNVNGNGQEYYLLTGSDFWFKPEQIAYEEKDLKEK